MANTAHLFLPDNPKYKAPYPGVVSPCGHSGTGKNAPWYQRVGVTGALVYDTVAAVTIIRAALRSNLEISA